MRAEDAGEKDNAKANFFSRVSVFLLRLTRFWKCSNDEHQCPSISKINRKDDETTSEDRIIEQYNESMYTKMFI